jgi:phenylpyruvate tautomerase PptA (4-oxalocrotonate tautomerase family)
MPIVHVHLRAGRTAAQKQAILDAVHAAFVEAFRLKPDDRFQLLHELPAEHFEAKYGPDTVLVEASVFQGRSADAKRRLFALAADHLERAGVRREAILVVLHDPPLENWGIRGGQSAADVKLGFAVDV